MERSPGSYEEEGEKNVSFWLTLGAGSTALMYQGSPAVCTRPPHPAVPLGWGDRPVDRGADA